MKGPGYTSERQAVIKASIAMNACGINQGTSGNVSARVPDGFLVTASGVSYEKMELDHVVHVTFDGGYYGDHLPSSEWRMHMDIYKEKPQARNIIHVHSPYATAISCLRQDIPAFHYMIAVAGGNSLRCADYATFGTERLSKNMMIALADRKACLLANHGMICFGGNFEQTLGLAVEIETLCRQYAIAAQTGKPAILGDEEMDLVLAKFQTYGPAGAQAEYNQTNAVVPPHRLD